MISLCMIVKNEEKHIKECIDSALPLVDEVVVVDTGSSDATLDILSHYPRDIMKVINAEWTNDFSRARNISLEHATHEWALVLDADEKVNFDGERFKQLMETTQEGVYRIPIYNLIDDSLPILSTEMQRLYRRKNAWYKGAVHEQLTYDDKVVHGSVLDEKIMNIIHYGYLEEHVNAKGKRDRNYDIIKQELERDPNDAFQWYHLGVAHMGRGAFQEALDAFESWRKLVSAKLPSYYMDVMFRVAECLYELRKYDELKKYLDRIGKDNHIKSNPMYCYHDGRLQNLLGKTKESIGAFMKAIEVGESNRQITKVGIGSFIPKYEIGNIFIRNREVTSGVLFYLEAFFCKENIIGFGYEDVRKMLSNKHRNDLLEVFEREAYRVENNLILVADDTNDPIDDARKGFLSNIEVLINEAKLDEASSFLSQLDDEVGLFSDTYAYKGLIELIRGKHLLAYLNFVLGLRYNLDDPDLMYNMAFTAEALGCDILAEHYKKRLEALGE